MRASIFCLPMLIVASALAQSSAPPIPTGLWQNKDDGLIVRVQACPAGFCGVAAGAPQGGKLKAQDICGKPIFSDFHWNDSSKKWEGHMQPPDGNHSFNSQVETDGTTFIKVHAHVGVISKTMSFTPFTGKVSDTCQMD